MKTNKRYMLYSPDKCSYPHDCFLGWFYRTFENELPQTLEQKQNIWSNQHTADTQQSARFLSFGHTQTHLAPECYQNQK